MMSAVSFALQSLFALLIVGGVSACVLWAVYKIFRQLFGRRWWLVLLWVVLMGWGVFHSWHQVWSMAAELHFPNPLRVFSFFPVWWWVVVAIMTEVLIAPYLRTRERKRG
ncbi:MAG: hypothetical protein JRN35_06150 [Nitrososphaerota archaeon]|nr:hypothetical protein [Nitrososphaerota archaeon]